MKFYDVRLNFFSSRVRFALVVILFTLIGVYTLFFPTICCILDNLVGWFNRSVIIRDRDGRIIVSDIAEFEPRVLSEENSISGSQKWVWIGFNSMPEAAIGVKTQIMEDEIYQVLTSNRDPATDPANHEIFAYNPIGWMKPVEIFTSISVSLSNSIKKIIGEYSLFFSHLSIQVFDLENASLIAMVEDFKTSPDGARHEIEGFSSILWNLSKEYMLKNNSKKEIVLSEKDIDDAFFDMNSAAFSKFSSFLIKFGFVSKCIPSCNYDRKSIKRCECGPNVKYATDSGLILNINPNLALLGIRNFLYKKRDLLSVWRVKDAAGSKIDFTGLEILCGVNKRMFVVKKASADNKSVGLWMPIIIPCGDSNCAISIFAEEINKNSSSALRGLGATLKMNELSSNVKDVVTAELGD